MVLGLKISYFLDATAEGEKVKSMWQYQNKKRVIKITRKFVLLVKLSYYERTFSGIIVTY